MADTKRKMGQILVDMKVTMAASRRKKNLDPVLINRFSDVVGELYDLLDKTPIGTLEKIKV